MASASMPINSGITPIFSDVEAEIINDYFKQLYENLKVNLTIQNLEFLIDMLNNSIDNKNINNKKKNNNNNYKKNKTNIKDLCTSFLSIINKYKIDTSNEEKKNQIETLTKILID
jgi:hypothetical protein